MSAEMVNVREGISDKAVFSPALMIDPNINLLPKPKSPPTDHCLSLSSTATSNSLTSLSRIASAVRKSRTFFASDLSCTKLSITILF